MTSTPTDQTRPDPAEPLLLPGQAAALPGPCDMTGMYVMHHAFRRDLARFATAARRTPVEDTRTWVALGQRWSRFAHELHSHHSKEDDAIWPLLLERTAAAGDDVGQAVLLAMEAEHGGIDPLLARVEDGLTTMRGGGPAAADDVVRSDVAAALEDLGVLLGAHLAHEEVDAIAVVQRYVGAEEWAHLEATRLRGEPTLPQLLFMLPWVVDGLPEAGVRRLLGGAPLPVRVLVRVGALGYRRLDRRAFAHAPV